MDVRPVAELVTAGPAQPGRPAHVAAASGLVRWRDRLLVAVDDEVAVDLLAGEVLELVPCELGDVDGVPLTLSDLEPCEDGMLTFAASAKDTRSTPTARRRY